MVKVITKQIHERLDNFIHQNQPADAPAEVNTSNLESMKETRPIKKKSDGLIERLDSKIFITEDNRQLLAD